MTVLNWTQKLDMIIYPTSIKLERNTEKQTLDTKIEDNKMQFDECTRVMKHKL